MPEPRRQPPKIPLSIRAIGREPLNDIILADASGASRVYGSYDEDVSRNQLPLFVKAADGSASRSYGDETLFNIATAGADCHEFSIYKNAGLDLDTLRCQTDYDPTITNLGELVQALYSSKAYKGLVDRSLTIFLTPEQFATLDNHYKKPAAPIERKTPQQLATGILSTPLDAAEGAPTFGSFMSSLITPESALGNPDKQRISDFLSALTHISKRGKVGHYRENFKKSPTVLTLIANRAGTFRETIASAIPPMLDDLAGMFGLTLETPHNNRKR